MRCCCCNTYIGRRRRSKIYSTSRRDYLEDEIVEDEDYGGEIDGNHYCVNCYEDVLNEEDEEDEEEE